MLDLGGRLNDRNRQRLECEGPMPGKILKSSPFCARSTQGNFKKTTEAAARSAEVVSHVTEIDQPEWQRAYRTFLFKMYQLGLYLSQDKLDVCHQAAPFSEATEGGENC